MVTDDCCHIQCKNSDGSDTYDSDKYLLISFAPSSGIGFYLFNEAICTFNIPTGEHSCLDDNAALIEIHKNFDQVRVMEKFSTKNDLIYRARIEYLRDKKNTYYAILLSKRLDTSLKAKTIQLLGSSELLDVSVSKKLPAILLETADPECVVSTVLQAVETNNTNVLRCLAEELAEVTFSQHSWLGNVIETVIGVPEQSSEAVVLVAALVRAARELPQIAKDAILQLLHAAEERVFEFKAAGVRALMIIAHSINRYSPELSLARVEIEEGLHAFAKNYSIAIRDLKFRTAQGFALRSASETFIPDQHLLKLGELAFESSYQFFGLTNLLHKFPWIPWTEQQPVLLESVMPMFLDVLNLRHEKRGRSFFQKMQSGLPFELFFLPYPDVGLTQKSVPPGYLAHLVFWLTFHANPMRATKTLFESDFRSHLKNVNKYSFAAWISIYEYFQNQEFIVIELYEALNVFSLAWILKSIDSPRGPHVIGLEAVEWITQQVRDQRIMEYLSSWSERSQLPNPFGVLVGNLLAFGSFMGSERMELLFEIAQWLSKQKAEIKPFVRFIV